MSRWLGIDQEKRYTGREAMDEAWPAWLWVALAVACSIMAGFMLWAVMQP